MTDELTSRAATLLRLGFDDEEAAQAIADEFELDDPEGEDVVSALEAARAALLAEQAGWPPVTDWDRLDMALGALNERGVLSVHLAGYTQSDGYSDVMEIWHEAGRPEGTIGYCFYHQQDAERALAGGGLYLAFGPMDPRQEGTEGPHVGRVIAEVARDAGLPVVWDGTFDQRILLSPFAYQRRIEA